MKKISFKIVTVVLLSLLFGACEKDDIGQFDSLVIDNPNNPKKFRQITFLVNLNHANNGYLNMPKIDSMKIYVNDKYWGTFSSAKRDTVDLTNKVINNLRYSENQIDYLLVAPYQLKTDNLQTAGDVVEYLNDRITLSPGDYICEVKEVNYTNLKGEVVSRETNVYTNFSVIENTTSSYVGEINIPIN